MAVLSRPHPGQLGGGDVVYVDYLESAPWNLRDYPDPPRYLGCGTVLLATAVRLSRVVGLGGRVGLHSLPRAESFYVRCGMQRVGPDDGYYGLSYFEYIGERAVRWADSLELNRDA